MKFTELEAIMYSKGVSTLAEIARALETTPQAVSNWKSRDQVPFHIVAKVNQKTNNQSDDGKNYFKPSSFNKDMISLSDILVAISDQLKVIVLIPVITIFLGFTYVKFIKEAKYLSTATLLLPEDSSGSLSGGLAGLASQFGVNTQNNIGASDLSSPSLIPTFLKSRLFAEKLLDKNFYISKFDKELTLLAYLTHGVEETKIERDTLIYDALPLLSQMIAIEARSGDPFNIIKITAPEPQLAKELADLIIEELELLNRYFKSRSVNDKINFINNRIFSVKNDLELSESRLKEFNEQNRQIASPSLQLEQDRLNRDVEIQKGIYLTLKQQLELSKIEEIQESSIIHVLDKPQIPLYPFNKNVKMTLLLSAIIGLGLGIIIGISRNYMKSADIDDRKKIRRMKLLLKNKAKDFIVDTRVTGVLSFMLIVCSPFYFGHVSQSPEFFGLYSSKLLIFNILYLIATLIIFYFFLYHYKNKRK